MDHINFLIILAAGLISYVICLVFSLSAPKKIYHKLEYIEPKITVALRHRFTSVEEFKSWRSWRNEISQNLKSLNK